MWRGSAVRAIFRAMTSTRKATIGVAGLSTVLVVTAAVAQMGDASKVDLKATPVGAGTLLDQTLIYGISEQGHDPKNHLMKDYHIVLMGKAGGKLPGNKFVPLSLSRKVTELVLTMQQVMGLRVTDWGTWDKTSKTVNEILT
jgi:hypothetical protein